MVLTYRLKRGVRGCVPVLCLKDTKPGQHGPQAVLLPNVAGPCAEALFSADGDAALVKEVTKVPVVVAVVVVVVVVASIVEVHKVREEERVVVCVRVWGLLHGDEKKVEDEKKVARSAVTYFHPVGVSWHSTPSLAATRSRAPDVGIDRAQPDMPSLK